MAPMSKQEFSRLDVLLRVQSGRLRIKSRMKFEDSLDHSYDFLHP